MDEKINLYSELYKILPLMNTRSSTSCQKDVAELTQTRNTSLDGKCLWITNSNTRTRQQTHEEVNKALL
jgi:hypothetical protein